MPITPQHMKIGSALAGVAFLGVTIGQIDNFTSFWDSHALGTKAYAMSNELDQAWREYMAAMSERERMQQEFYTQQYQQYQQMQRPAPQAPSIWIEEDRDGRWCCDGYECWPWDSQYGCS